MTGQYEEQNWSPTGDSPQQPNYRPGNGSTGQEPTQSGSVSNSPGTPGAPGAPGNSGSSGDSGGNGGDGNNNRGQGTQGGGNGANNAGSGANGGTPTSGLDDRTVAQVPDASISSPSGTEGGGSSSLIWILIAVLALAGVSGGVALRMRANKNP